MCGEHAYARVGAARIKFANSPPRVHLSLSLYLESKYLLCSSTFSESASRLWISRYVHACRASSGATLFCWGHFRARTPKIFFWRLCQISGTSPRPLICLPSSNFISRSFSDNSALPDQQRLAPLRKETKGLAFVNNTPPLAFQQNIFTASTMSSRPQNIGIKAIEIYFPNQVC